MSRGRTLLEGLENASQAKKTENAPDTEDADALAHPGPARQLGRFARLGVGSPQELERKSGKAVDDKPGTSVVLCAVSRCAKSTQCGGGVCVCYA